MAIDESIAARPHAEVLPTMTTSLISEPTPREVIRKAQERGVQIVDLRFTDLLGSWHHFIIPVGQMPEALF